MRFHRQKCTVCASLDRLAEVNILFTDFDGVHTDNSAFLLESGVEAVRINRSDGLGVEMWKRSGGKLVIVSAEVKPMARVRAEKLGVESIIGSRDKKTDVLKAIREAKGIGKTLFLGNDINDLPAFQAVHIGVGVCDSEIELLAQCDIVLRRKGGHGAVREMIDILLRAREGLCHWCLGGSSLRKH